MGAGVVLVHTLLRAVGCSSRTGHESTRMLSLMIVLMLSDLKRPVAHLLINAPFITSFLFNFIQLHVDVELMEDQFVCVCPQGRAVWSRWAAICSRFLTYQVDNGSNLDGDSG